MVVGCWRLEVEAACYAASFGAVDIGIDEDPAADSPQPSPGNIMPLSLHEHNRAH